MPSGGRNHRKPRRRKARGAPHRTACVQTERETPGAPERLNQGSCPCRPHRAAPHRSPPPPPPVPGSRRRRATAPPGTAGRRVPLPTVFPEAAGPSSPAPLSPAPRRPQWQRRLWPSPPRRPHPARVSAGRAAQAGLRAAEGDRNRSTGREKPCRFGVLWAPGSRSGTPCSCGGCGIPGVLLRQKAGVRGRGGGGTASAGRGLLAALPLPRVSCLGEHAAAAHQPPQDSPPSILGSLLLIAVPICHGHLGFKSTSAERT
nr:formin-like protein 5 [Anser cygnoides]